MLSRLSVNSMRKELKEYTYLHRVPTETWRRQAEQDDTTHECLNCGELVKPFQKFCSLYCRVELNQK